MGLTNAAVWFGAALFFTVGIGRAVFSQDMRHLLGANNFPYFSGAIAQVLIARYFDLQIVCGLIALAHAVAEWLYLGRPLHKFWTGLLAGLLAVGLLGGFVLQPKIRKLHRIKYAQNRSKADHEAAGRALRLWHGGAQTINVLMLAGLGVHLWRVAHPASPTRFVTAAKIQG